MIDTKKILMSVAMFMMAMSAADAQAPDGVAEINRGIWNARQQIEKQRTLRATRVKNELLRNSDYRYVSEHADEVAKLRHQNEQLIERACDIVRQKSRPQMVLVARTPMVFMLYSSKYPEVSSLHGMYDCNCRQITIYERRLEKIRGLEQRVKNRHDSIMYEQINRYQLMIDSLLTLKMEKIR